MWLRDTGILDKMKDIILPAHIPTQYPRAQHQQSLSINQMSIILIIFVIGITLSIIVFILELFKNSSKEGNLPPAELIELTEGNAIRENSSSELAPSNQLQSDSGIAL